MSAVIRYTVPVLLLAIAAISCGAAELPEPAVVTLQSGGLTVELQQSHAWNIQRISYQGVEVASRTGSYGALICVPATGGWVGGPHTLGGIEQIEEIVLIVDGESVPLDDGARYSGGRIVLHKKSMLDLIRLEATMTIDEGVITQEHTLTATEDVMVTVAYPFMFCVTADTTHWLAVTTGGEALQGRFTNGRDLDWHDDWAWTAAFIPQSGTGVLMRHLDRPENATAMTGYWDHDRYHKLYVRWDSDSDRWREGRVLSGGFELRAFKAPPADWEDSVRTMASEWGMP
jgi:hypothetical protein